MTFRFDDATRRLVADRCAAFTRLPGDAAHALKHAAVAITLTDAADGSGETALILTGRVAGLRSHGGQWALPGGRIDAGETPAQGALRELAEEIGLELAPDDIVGTLDDYPTRSGYLITPVVVWGGDHPPLRLNPAEVASIRRIRLVDIAREDAIEFDTHSGKRAARGAAEHQRPVHPRADRRADLPVPRSAGRTADPRRRPGAAGVRVAIEALQRSRAR